MKFQPIWVTVLPRERRARHFYQLCVMLLLITVGVSQLMIGPVDGSSLNDLPAGQAALLSWFCVFAGTAGLSAALIPERVVTWRRWEFDATWARLWVELAAHGLLVFVWASYFSAIVMVYPFVTGLSLGTGAAIWLGVAAIGRCCQILWTLKKAMWDAPNPSTITGVIDGPPSG